MLVLPLDSLRRCECQPTPPMLWLRSDSRLVWHLLGGGRFLWLGGLGGGGGSHRGWERPQGHGSAPRRAEREGGLLLVGSHAEREGRRPRWAPRRGAAGCTPQTPQPDPEGRSSSRSSSSCLGSGARSARSAEPGLDPLCPGRGAQPASHLRASSLGACGARSRALQPPEPRGTTRLGAIPGPIPGAIPGRSLCFPARPSLQGTPPTAASSGSTRGAATAARSAPSPPPPARR